MGGDFRRSRSGPRDPGRERMFSDDRRDERSATPVRMMTEFVSSSFRSGADHFSSMYYFGPT